MTKLYRATAAIFLGFIALLLVPAAPAWAAGPSISISAPSDPVSGTVSFSWSVSAESGYSLTYVRVWVSGPGTGGSRHYLDCRPSSCSATQSLGGSQSGTESWDTRSRSGATGNFNGTYTLQVDAQETPNLVGSSQQSSKASTFHVNNTPGTPSWVQAPTATTYNGSPAIAFSWSYPAYPNQEPDTREFLIERSGPTGDGVAAVSAANPTGPCSVSGSTFSCTDVVFPAQGYGGTYTYTIVADRYTTASSVQTSCALDPNGNRYPDGATHDRCIDGQPTSSQSATLTEPSPTPTDSGSPSPSGTPTTIGVSGGGGTPHGNTGGTRVGGVTKQQANLPGDNNYADFYTGTYSEQLPYQDRTLILPFGSKPGTPGNKSTIETVKGSGGPIALSLKDRAVLLPLAGGLLLFLGAAHVRRLLADR